MKAFKYVLVLVTSLLVAVQLGALATTLEESCNTEHPPQSCMFLSNGIKVTGNGVMQTARSADGKTMIYAIDDRGSSGNLIGCNGTAFWAFDHDSRLGTNEFDGRYQGAGGKIVGWFSSNTGNKVGHARITVTNKGDDLHAGCGDA